jgi:hypothetical protein
MNGRVGTAAVKAAPATIEIFFFMDRPRVGSEQSIFNMQRSDPTVTTSQKRDIDFYCTYNLN